MPDDCFQLLQRKRIIPPRKGMRSCRQSFATKSACQKQQRDMATAVGTHVTITIRTPLAVSKTRSGVCQSWSCCCCCCCCLSKSEAWTPADSALKALRRPSFILARSLPPPEDATQKTLPDQKSIRIPCPCHVGRSKKPSVRLPNLNPIKQSCTYHHLTPFTSDRAVRCHRQMKHFDL